MREKLRGKLRGKRGGKRVKNRLVFNAVALSRLKRLDFFLKYFPINNAKLTTWCAIVTRVHYALIYRGIF